MTGTWSADVGHIYVFSCICEGNGPEIKCDRRVTFVDASAICFPSRAVPSAKPRADFFASNWQSVCSYVFIFISCSKCRVAFNLLLISVAGIVFRFRFLDNNFYFPERDFISHLSSYLPTRKHYDFTRGLRVFKM